jgi:hypothetical protein
MLVSGREIPAYPCHPQLSVMATFSSMERKQQISIRVNPLTPICNRTMPGPIRGKPCRLIAAKGMPAQAAEANHPSAPLPSRRISPILENPAVARLATLLRAAMGLIALKKSVFE